jgi:cell wall-associated NlpC family hydrolase
MHRLARGTAAIAAVATLVLAGVALPHAKADPLANARARASALAKSVNRLETQTEVATERYDAAQGELSIAVAEQGQADQRVSAMQAAATRAQQTVTDRARALYESGGDPAVMASLLSGQSPTAAIDRFRLAGDVIDFDKRSEQAAAATLARAHAVEANDTTISREITKLQVARQAAAAKVQSLLASQRQALAGADATVRRIMRADQAAAAAASAAAFDDAVSAAGGVIATGSSTKPPNATAAAAIAAARSRLGVPYVWGATGPDSFDCSGLTQWSYAHAGINLPRTAAEQWNAGPHPALTDLEPGDLLFWALNTNDPATIHHVAMYIGNGMMIAAPHTGENVQIQPVYLAGFIGAMRPWQVQRQ